MRACVVVAKAHSGSSDKPTSVISQLVDAFREGDASQTPVHELPDTIDLLLLDKPSHCIPRSGTWQRAAQSPGFIVADNADYDPEYLKLGSG
ncbi:MAG TPA: hypothetical protein VFW60_01715 [Rhodanobacteraceae bacterium]|nr:hypothetical protein [Rhodanobacteraceae bacterium]